MRRSLDISAARKERSTETYFNSRGEMNATSATDALLQVGNLLKAIQNGDVAFSNSDVASKTDIAAKKAADNAAFVEAYRLGINSDQFVDIGAKFVASIIDSAERQGFMRNNLVKTDVSVGEAFRVRRKERGFAHVVATIGDGAIASRYVSDPILEGYFNLIHDNVRVLERDMYNGQADLVEDVYLRMVQGVSAKEDDIYMKQVRTAARTVGHSRVASSVTNLLLGRAKSDLDKSGVDAKKLYIGNGLWSHFHDANFRMDPATQFEMLTTGRVGRLFGMDIYSDGFRLPGLKAMDTEEMYMISSPEFHGGWAERAPLAAVPRDNFDDGQPARGWYMYIFVGSLIANARSVSHIRIA